MCEFKEKSVAPNGDVYPCVKLHFPQNYICNLLEEEAVQKFKDNRKKVIETELVDSLRRCRQCSIRYICGGGCRADEQFNQGIKSDYSQCDLQEINLKYFMENVHE